MSEVSLEYLATQVDKLTEQVGETPLIDWKSVQNSQLEMSKSLDALNRSLMNLRNAMQQNYVKTLRELKSYDIRDLAKIIKDGKQTSSCLESVLPHVKKDTEGNAILNKESLVKSSKQIEDKFASSNNQISQFLFESVQKMEKLSKDFIQTPKVVEEETKSSDTNNFEDSDKSAKNYLEESKYNFDQSKLIEIVSQIKLQYIPDTDKCISIQTYGDIVSKSIGLSFPVYQRLTFENREERRRNQFDTKKYVKLMIDYTNDVSGLLEKSQEVIIEKLGISRKQYQKSEMVLVERGLQQHLLVMQQSVLTQIKDKMPRNKNMSVKQCKQLNKFKVQLMSEKQQLFKPALMEVMNNYNTEQVPIILNYVMNDLVYEAKQVEEEDYMYELNDPKIFQDQEIVELSKQIEQAILVLFNDIGYLEKQRQAMEAMQKMQEQGGNMTGYGMGGNTQQSSKKKSNQEGQNKPADKKNEESKGKKQSKEEQTKEMIKNYQKAQESGGIYFM